MGTKNVNKGGGEDLTTTVSIDDKECNDNAKSSLFPTINGLRVRDMNGYRQRAAAFCARVIAPTVEDVSNNETHVNYRQTTPKKIVAITTARLEVLMVSGRREHFGQHNYWVLPGGGVENLESTEQAVVRELREEAGILGKVLFRIGKFIDEQRFHHTTLYFLSVLETFDEWENCRNGRERRWMGMEEAKRCIKPNQLDMLLKSIITIEKTLSAEHIDITDSSINNSCTEAVTHTQLQRHTDT